MKTLDNKSILIELEDEGWKFSCENFDINIDNGLYLGIKNSYKENQNICVSGMCKDKNKIIKWEITRTIMKKIKTALISVSDKKKLKSLLNSLKQNKIKIISSGGTYKEIRKLKFKCLEVSEFTSSPEILEGRVKTLHPKIHAGILNKRKSKTHLRDIKNNNFENIDLVIVNFYPFEETLKNTKNHEKIIENIDVGGPTMVRSAAKNYKDVTVITSPDQYDEFIEELRLNNGSTSLEFREKLSRIAFTETAYYDSVISNYFNKKNDVIFPEQKSVSCKSC